MTEQRERARSKAKTLTWPTTRSIATSSKVAYDRVRRTRRVALQHRDEVLASLVGKDGVGELFLDSTPFYAESGGQVADTGMIVTETGSFKVLDVQNVAGGLFAHRGLLTGELLPGQARWRRSIRSDARRRGETTRHAPLARGTAHGVGRPRSPAGILRRTGPIALRLLHGAGVTPQETAEILTLVNSDVVANEEVNTIQRRRRTPRRWGRSLFR